MADYIPKDDAGRILWLKNFAAWVSANGAGYGISPTDIFNLNAAVSAADAALTNHITQKTLAHSATANKNAAMGGATDLARHEAQRIQAATGITPALLAAAGLPVHDTDITPTPAGEILAIAPPLMLLDFSHRRQVTIHWGANPANERLNARPAGTLGCEIQYARGGIPTDEAQWISLGNDTESPFDHITNDTTPTTYAYRARYFGRQLTHGSFCDPVVCTVSV